MTLQILDQLESGHAPQIQALQHSDCTKEISERLENFAVVEGDGTVTQAIADRALTRLGVDDLGLDGGDRRYLRLLAEHYAGGPVGIETISAALSEARDALEEVIEPFLLQSGLIQRTPRGRMLAAKAWTHLGLEPPRAPEAPRPAPDLFDEP